MRKVLTSIVLALALHAPGMAQGSPPAREIARKSLPSVVVLVSRDAEGNPVTLGSGFFVTPRLLATNLHVIEDASRVTARLVTGDEREYQIEGSVAIDEANDLVLLKIGASAGRALPIAGNTRSEIGDTVYVAGNPAGLVGSFSQGIISAFRDSDFIQITAPISGGSSGSPVMNDRGDVIGIATLAIREGQNLNFAIPVSRLVALLNKASDVRPLSPRARLAFDGLYSASFQTARCSPPRQGCDGSEVTRWLRFHEDATVFMSSSAPSVSLQRIFGWLDRDGAAPYSGTYTVRGARIEFALYSGSIEHSVFRGVVHAKGLRLTEELLSGSEAAPVEYRFIRVANHHAPALPR